MNTLEELKQLIKSSFGIEPKTLKADAPLADYGLDSLSLAELLFAIEEHFNLDFPDDRADVKTLAGLAALIDELKLAAIA
ncbi:MAG: Phosphopantetheine-binding protein [Proteobacteria bacterium]|nr:Phosphopantetheine-binding protein [Pseudomonadota bacterium]